MLSDELSIIRGAILGLKRVQLWVDSVISTGSLPSCRSTNIHLTLSIWGLFFYASKISCGIEVDLWVGMVMYPGCGCILDQKFGRDSGILVSVECLCRYSYCGVLFLEPSKDRSGDGLAFILSNETLSTPCRCTGTREDV